MRRTVLFTALVALGLAGNLTPVYAGSLSGLDPNNRDEAVRPQDDLYKYANGGWLARTEIPADKGEYGAFDELSEAALAHVRAIIDALPASSSKDPVARKLRDLYASFMDEPEIERTGMGSLKPEFARIAKVRSAAELPALIGHLNRLQIPTPFSPQVHQDAKEATRYVFDLKQDGLGLPTRDYYLESSEKLVDARNHYERYITTALTHAGVRQAAMRAHEIVDLETALAKAQWSGEDNRDPAKLYNKFTFEQLKALTPGFDWPAYLKATGVAGRVDYLIVSQPSYLTKVAELLRSTPLDTWKTYFYWRVLTGCTPYLGDTWVKDRFAFYGTELKGIPSMRPRWQRGLGLVEGALGEGLGKLYVERYFPATAKVRMEKLVQNLLIAYKADIDNLEWMSPETKTEAQKKLALFTAKIGYPDTFNDYHTLTVKRHDLLGNVLRSNQHDYDHDLFQLGGPIDHTEWGMTPQTVNAYYSSELNTIFFPAAILQPPFFSADADDAVNYGAIGAVIGHEISHGFDDAGSQYDGHGTLLDAPGWFTAEDLARFKSRTQALIAQYGTYALVPGYPINGQLTLGENIADNSGLAIAYMAYQLSLEGKSAPVIDGLSGDQRFFMGWAQVWRCKTRDAQAIVAVKSNVHAPDQFRGLLPERNLEAFYRAFTVKEGDKMYLPEAQRVRIW